MLLLGSDDECVDFSQSFDILIWIQVSIFLEMSWIENSQNIGYCPVKT